MKVKMSAYLQSIKPLAKRLVDQLKKDYAYVSLLGADSTGKSYGVKRTGVTLNDSMWAERGFVVRVFNGKNYSEHSFNELTEDNIGQVEEKIRATAEMMNELMTAEGFDITEYKLLEETVIKDSFLSEVEVAQNDLSHEEILDRLRGLMELTLKESDELVDVRVMLEEVQVSKMFLSEAKDLEQSYVWTNAYVVPIGVREGNMKYTHTVVSGLKGLELLDELSDECAASVEHLNM